jgi:hypothetical protein
MGGMSQHRACLGSVERKCDMAWQHDNVGQRRGGINWADMNLTALKNEENLRYRINCYKWTVKILSINELI